MKFVTVTENVEYVAYEVRIATPEDADTFLVARTIRETKEDGKAEWIAENEAEQLRSYGFPASVWRVSRQQLCELLKHKRV